jgi:hypothetical protein
MKDRGRATPERPGQLPYRSGGAQPWHLDPGLTAAPGYGAAVSSPLRVGGRITGVDEALRVAVIDGNGRTLGRVSGVPAGGGTHPGP